MKSVLLTAVALASSVAVAGGDTYRVDGDVDARATGWTLERVDQCNTDGGVFAVFTEDYQFVYYTSNVLDVITLSTVCANEGNNVAAFDLVGDGTFAQVAVDQTFAGSPGFDEPK